MGVFLPSAEDFRVPPKGGLRRLLEVLGVSSESLPAILPVASPFSPFPSTYSDGNRPERGETGEGSGEELGEGLSLKRSPSSISDAMVEPISGAPPVMANGESGYSKVGGGWSVADALEGGGAAGCWSVVNVAVLEGGGVASTSST